ncbi:unnamed protein product [Knipowitschia caucasica]
MESGPRPEPLDPIPAEELPVMDNITDLEMEQLPNTVFDTKSHEETVRKSVRTVKPREMFTYTHLGQPSYQAWRPAANMMFAYPMPCYPTQPDMYYYPTPMWTC